MSNKLEVHFEQGSTEALDLKLNYILCIIWEQAFYSRVIIAAGVLIIW